MTLYSYEPLFLLKALCTAFALGVGWSLGCFVVGKVLK